MGTILEDVCIFMIKSRQILRRIRNVLDTIWREIKTNFVFNKIFRKSCKIWDNVEKHGRAREATDDNVTRLSAG
jgi:hypothetical protein